MSLVFFFAHFLSTKRSFSSLALQRSEKEQESDKYQFSLCPTLILPVVVLQMRFFYDICGVFLNRKVRAACVCMCVRGSIPEIFA